MAQMAFSWLIHRGDPITTYPSWKPDPPSYGWFASRKVKLWHRGMSKWFLPKRPVSNVHRRGWFMKVPTLQERWNMMSAFGQAKNQGIVGCTLGPTYPYGKSLYKPYIGVSYPQESLENTINTMGTLLGVHPSVPWKNCWKRFCFFLVVKRLLEDFNHGRFSMVSPKRR